MRDTLKNRVPWLAFYPSQTYTEYVAGRVPGPDPRRRRAPTPILMKRVLRRAISLCLYKSFLMPPKARASF